MPLLRRRRPLLRAAAVSAGTHYIDKKRAAKAAEPAGYAEPAPAGYAAPPPAGYAAPAPAPAPAAPQESTLDQLEKLGRLHEQGVLNDEEFAQQKAKVLNA
jgi:hypothetical protein